MSLPILQQLVEGAAIRRKKLVNKVTNLGQLLAHLLDALASGALGRTKLLVSCMGLVYALDECTDLVGGLDQPPQVLVSSSVPRSSKRAS